MFDNRHFGWKPENSKTWASQVSSQPSLNVSSLDATHKAAKSLPAQSLAPFISEHELTLSPRYPTWAPLDPFGHDD